MTETPEILSIRVAGYERAEAEYKRQIASWQNSANNDGKQILDLKREIGALQGKVGDLMAELTEMAGKREAAVSAWKTEHDAVDQLQAELKQVQGRHITDPGHAFASDPTHPATFSFDEDDEQYDPTGEWLDEGNCWLTRELIIELDQPEEVDAYCAAFPLAARIHDYDDEDD